MAPTLVALPDGFRRLAPVLALACLLVLAPLAGAAPEAPVEGLSLKVIPVIAGYPQGRITPAFLFLRLPAGVELLRDELYPPMELGLEAAEGITVAAAGLLPPFEGEAHREKAVLRLDIKVAPEVAPGDQELTARLLIRFAGGKAAQAGFTMPITVLPAGEEPRVLSPEMLAGLNGAGLDALPTAPGAPAASASGAPQAASPGDPYAGHSLLLMLGLVFLGGLGLNLTPCVYPLIPITVGFFGGRAAGSRAQTIIHALLYWAGMAITYSVLGAVISVSGRMLGEALTRPEVTVFIAAVILAMAASMFGLWEIRLPAALNRLASRNHVGHLGTLGMGLTVGLLAAPCVGPFVVALMTHVALVGRLGYGLLVFFTLSAGLGLPLAVLAVFSGSLARLPGAGGWMVWVRKFFGVVLVLMALYVLEPLLGGAGLVLALAGAGAAGGLYLALTARGGWGGGFERLRKAAGFCLVAAALVLGGVHFLGGAAAPEAEIAWQGFTPRLVEEAKAQGRPVVIDIMADWCAPCRRMEATTFADPRVVAALAEFRPLRIDVTRGAPPEAEEALRAWSIRGVPTIIFLDGQGRWLRELTIVGYAGPDAFLEYLTNARRKKNG